MLAGGICFRSRERREPILDSVTVAQALARSRANLLIDMQLDLFVSTFKVRRSETRGRDVCNRHDLQHSSFCRTMSADQPNPEYVLPLNPGCHWLACAFMRN